jgi:heptosyltransferase-2
LLEFAAIVSRCAVLVTSDSLALHVAVARDVPVVAFFAPTSAAEIELYGMGEKVVSTAPDACSYKPDADTSTLTVERLQDAVVGRLARAQG